MSFLEFHQSFICRASSGGGAVVFSSAPVPPPEPALGWQQCPVSSDEGETDLLEESEKPPCHYSPQHPRPMSVSCTKPLHYNIWDPEYCVKHLKWSDMMWKLIVSCLSAVRSAVGWWDEGTTCSTGGGTGVRLALHSMVEKHVNSLMWRWVPAWHSYTLVQPLAKLLLMNNVFMGAYFQFTFPL